MPTIRCRQIFLGSMKLGRLLWDPKPLKGHEAAFDREFQHSTKCLDFSHENPGKMSLAKDQKQLSLHARIVATDIFVRKMH